MSSEEAQVIEEDEVFEVEDDVQLAEEGEKTPEEAALPAAANTATRWSWPNGFSKEHSKELQLQVDKAYRSLSAAKHNGNPLQNVQAKYNAAVQARQAAVDEFLQQKTVKQVNAHTTAEVNRCIQEVKTLLADRKRKAPAAPAASAAAPPSSTAAAPPSSTGAVPPPSADANPPAAADGGSMSSGTKKCQFCDERFGTDRGLATHMTRSHKGQKPAKKPRNGFNAEILKKYKNDRLLKKMIVSFIWAGLGEVEDPDKAALTEALDNLVKACLDLVRLRNEADCVNQSIVHNCWCITVGRLRETGKPFPRPTLMLEGLVSAMAAYLVKTERKEPVVKTEPVVSLVIED